MINLLLFLLFIACGGLASAWIAENPGDLTLFWFGYRVDTSVAFILVVVLALAVALTLSILVIRRIMLGPEAFFHRRNLNMYKRAMSELAYSVAALAASDITSAEAHTKKAQKLIGRSPITLLLSAQIAKSKGDDAATRLLLEQLLEHKETEYLAARSLSDVANKQQNLQAALAMATRAQAMNPKENSAALAVVSLKTRLGEWDAALRALSKTKLPRAQRQRLHALIQLTRGELLLENGQDETALILARQVVHALAEFPPAAAFAARAFSENHQLRKSIRILKHAWAKKPHPLLRETLEDIAAGELPGKQEKLRSILIGTAPKGEWVCDHCGHREPAWQLHCSSCTSIDSIRWK